MPLLPLRHGSLHVELLPEAGGSIARCYTMATGQAVHVLRPASDEAIAQRRVEEMACFPMLPLCGRLRRGQFSLPSGEVIALPPAFRPRHFLHGVGWQEAWSLLDHSDDTATLQLQVGAGVEPFRFTATQHVVVDATGLTLGLSVRNEAELPLPYGIGLHPYFPRTAETQIRTRIAGLWEADAEILPLFPAAASTLATTMAAGLQPDDWPLDSTAYGWGRALTVSNGSLIVNLLASEPSRWLTIYTPPGQDYFCLEPCTQVPDFPNLARYPAEQTGGHWLAPRQTLAISMRLALELK